MARLLTVLLVSLVVGFVISDRELLRSKQENFRQQLDEGLETAGGSLRTKRSRSNSRYNPASAQVNPNRGRKRVRLSDGRPEFQTERQPEPIATSPPRNVFQGQSREPQQQNTSQPRNVFRGQSREPQQQTTSQPRNLNRGGSRRQQLKRTRPSLRSFETTTERVQAVNRLTKRPVQTRGRNIKNNRNNNNRFYEETAEKRNELFSDSKSKYCRPGFNDYYDYDDYDRIDIQSSQNQAPLTIEVTHQLPSATQRNNFHIPNVISSIEVLSVNGLRSTDIDNLPVIYANAYTLTKQPGYNEILYDALRATETLQVTFAPTCLNGRQTSYAQQSTSTIYSVETVTERVYEEVIPTTNINDLLLQFLPNTKKPSPILFQPASQLILSTAPLTTFVTHTSTYVTKITESESTELSLMFRGKPIVTTIIETSVKEITATEFSTETLVTSQLITQTVSAPKVLPTSILSPFINQPNADIEKQLILQQLNNLLSKQSSATPPKVQDPDQNQAIQGKSETYEVTLTNSYVTTLTEKNSQVIPLTFRGKAIETTLYDTATKVITATEYTTETLTKPVAPSPPAANILATRNSPQQIDNFDLINLLPELVEQLALLGNPTPQIGLVNPDYKDILQANFNPSVDSLLEQQLIEALVGRVDYNEIKTEAKNENIFIQATRSPESKALINQDPVEPEINKVNKQAPLEPEINTVINQAQISPDVPERQFTVTTIFKSGRTPGEFTRILSTVYFDEGRSRREAGINPSKSTLQDKTAFPLLEPDGTQSEHYIDANLIQSGKYF